MQGSGSWNSSSQTNAPCLDEHVPFGRIDRNLDGNPTPLGACITTQKGAAATRTCSVLSAPRRRSRRRSMFNLRARYDWTMGDYKPFAWVGANHIGSERNEPASFTTGNTQIIPTTTLLLYTMPGYTTYDGVDRRRQGQLDGDGKRRNLFNNSCSTNTTSRQSVKTEYPLVPRVLMRDFVEMKF